MPTPANRPLVSLRLLPAVAMIAMLGSCALVRSADEGRAEPDSSTIEVITDENTIPVDLATLEADVDQVVVMQIGGFAKPDPSMFGADEVLFVRHVLRASTATGPIDLFDLVLKMDEPGPGPGPQQCTALNFDTGMSMSCGPFEDGQAGPQNILGGYSGSENLTIFELNGPPRTTHFVVEHDERRIAVNAIDDRAVLPLATGGRCPRIPTLIEAWGGDVLLDSEVPEGHC